MPCASPDLPRDEIEAQVSHVEDPDVVRSGEREVEPHLPVARVIDREPGLSKPRRHERRDLSVVLDKQRARGAGRVSGRPRVFEALVAAPHYGSVIHRLLALL